MTKNERIYVTKNIFLKYFQKTTRTDTQRHDTLKQT